jgi:WD40 repeat protein
LALLLVVNAACTLASPSPADTTTANPATTGTGLVASTSETGWVAYATGPSAPLLWITREGEAPRRLFDPVEGTLGACPRFSPDGARLAYVEVEKGIPVSREPKRQVVIVAFDDVGTVSPPIMRLPTTSSASGCPEWSPDGESIAFVDADHHLSLRDLDGSIKSWSGQVDIITHFEWSPDGRQIAAAGGEKLWLFPIEGADALPVTGSESLFNGDQWLQGLSWSDDGTELLADFFESLGKVDLNTGDVTVSQGTELVSPDQFLTARTDAQSGRLAIFDSTGGETTIASRLREVEGLPMGGIDTIVMSPDGSHLLAVVWSLPLGKRSLATMPIDPDAPATVLVEASLDIEWVAGGRGWNDHHISWQSASADQ